VFIEVKQTKEFLGSVFFYPGVIDGDFLLHVHTATNAEFVPFAGIHTGSTTGVVVRRFDAGKKRFVDTDGKKGLI